MPIAFPEKILGLFETYLLLEKESVILVDLQAAERRIAFEEGSNRAASSFYSIDAAREIWKRLQSCSDLRYDPQGRLIWKEIKQKDWEKTLRTL